MLIYTRIKYLPLNHCSGRRHLDWQPSFFLFYSFVPLCSNIHPDRNDVIIENNISPTSSFISLHQICLLLLQFWAVQTLELWLGTARQILQSCPPLGTRAPHSLNLHRPSPAAWDTLTACTLPDPCVPYLKIIREVADSLSYYCCLGSSATTLKFLTIFKRAPLALRLLKQALRLAFVSQSNQSSKFLSGNLQFCRVRGCYVLPWPCTIGLKMSNNYIRLRCRSFCSFVWSHLSPVWLPNSYLSSFLWAFFDACIAAWIALYVNVSVV